MARESVSTVLGARATQALITRTEKKIVLNLYPRSRNDNLVIMSKPVRPGSERPKKESCKTNDFFRTQLAENLVKAKILLFQASKT